MVFYKLQTFRQSTDICTDIHTTPLLEDDHVNLVLLKNLSNDSKAINRLIFGRLYFGKVSVMLNKTRGLETQTESFKLNRFRSCQKMMKNKFKFEVSWSNNG